MRYKLPRLRQDLKNPPRSGFDYSKVESGSTQAVLAPLSRAQERLWFMEQLEPGNPVYNLAFVLHLDGPIDSHALEIAA